jgi:hypothetical protein
VQAFGSHVLYGPGKARYDDHSLAVYEKAGFAPADAEQLLADTIARATDIATQFPRLRE